MNCPKNLFFLVQFRLEEARRKRDDYALKKKREMWQLWRGKARAYKNVMDLMERKS